MINLTNVDQSTHVNRFDCMITFVSKTSWIQTVLPYIIILFRYRLIGTATTDAHFGRGEGSIVLDNINCSGAETSLEDCAHKVWGTHNCGHEEDAGMRCF